MKAIKIPIILVCVAFVLTMTACLENSTEPEIVIDYGASSYYYISNKTGTNLQVTYKIAFIEMDSTVIVPADTTFEIFQAGDIGIPPKPSEAFNKIEISQLMENQSPPFLTIYPVTDEDWTIIDEDLNEIDPESTNIYRKDGSAHYELIISDEEIH